MSWTSCKEAASAGGASAAETAAEDAGAAAETAAGGSGAAETAAGDSAAAETAAETPSARPSPARRLWRGGGCGAACFRRAGGDDGSGDDDRDTPWVATCPLLTWRLASGAEPAGLVLEAAAAETAAGGAGAPNMDLINEST